MPRYFELQDITFQQLLEKMEHFHSFSLLPKQHTPVQGIYDVPEMRSSLKFETETCVTISYMFSVASEPTQGNFNSTEFFKLYKGASSVVFNPFTRQANLLYTLVRISSQSQSWEGL